MAIRDISLATVVPLLPSKEPPGSPLWWAEKLHQQLLTRQPEIELYRRYAWGDHDDPTLVERATRSFARIIGLSKTNLSGLIIDAAAERMGVQGFRFGDAPEADEDAWELWQTSNFDLESELLITEALTTGRSFVLAEPPGPGDKWPRLYAEAPDQMIIAYQPGRRTDRLAAWKEWVDEWTGFIHATLYLPDQIVKLKSPPRQAGVGGTMVPVVWELRDERTESEENPFGEVPVWEIPNRPMLDPNIVRSEIADVLSDQDACNHIALNALIAAEYGAFKQKWLTGMEVPRDPQTGEPIEPFNAAVDRIFVAESEAARFGDFDATDLRPYIELYESRVKHMAAVTRTPVAMLLGGMVNLAAEALALSVAGLVQKVKRKTRHVEQPFEDALRSCFRLMGDPRGDEVAAETIWEEAEVRSAAQQADAAVKLVQGNVLTPQTVQERYLGMSNEEMQRDMTWREQNVTVPGMEELFGGGEPDPRLMGGMGGADNERELHGPDIIR